MTERVIEAVRRDPAASALPYLLPYVNVPWVEGGTPRPMPENVLAEAAFPSGRPLSPSLRAWLAYDTSLLERHHWFTPDGGFAPRPLDQLVADEMGDFWGPEFAWLSGHFAECFLLPGGSDSRRVLAVTEPDEEGEYPVLALDFDDLPYLGLMYPGFDVYLADTAELLDLAKRKTYSDLISHPTYGPRMRRHAVQSLAGSAAIEYPFDFEPLYTELTGPAEPTRP
ncbi:hypothetical protein [Streptomyces sp. SID13726]|uniref:hypothetical protein n=1 Tax=Streptomyces sp. SID13726 TaxID=2706058 RepID=UPI001EF2798F|nr:hypothetical protein [Streptomyces sp. SID13726]